MLKRGFVKQFNSPHFKTVLNPGFHAKDSGFQGMDSGFFVSGTWIQDSSC